MSKIVMLDPERILSHPDNPRKDLGDIKELTASVASNGILQNLTVVENSDNPGYYTVVIGHRRLAAAKAAGLHEVPCVISDMDYRTQIETMLCENMQRQDLTFYEQARSFQMVLDLGCSIKELTERTGFSKRTIDRRLEMAKLDPRRLKQTQGRQISLKDFDDLSKINDVEVRNELLDHIGTNNWDFEYRRAITKQNAKKELERLMPELEAVGAMRITIAESWNNKYTLYPDAMTYHLSGPKTCFPTFKEGLKVFYTLSGPCDAYLSFYALTSEACPKEPKPKISDEEKKKRAEASAAWKALEELENEAYCLRFEFMASVKPTKDHIPALMNYAAYVAVAGGLTHSSADTAGLVGLLGLKNYPYHPELEAAFDTVTTSLATYAKMIYYSFGDQSDIHTAGAMRSPEELPRYFKNEKHEMLYEFLGALGYRASDAELKLLNGEWYEEGS